MRLAIRRLAPCVLLLTTSLYAAGNSAPPCAHNPVTQAELLRRTQQMFDAVAPGEKAPWDKNFAADAVYFDEKGRNMDKPALLADLSPLPKGYSGSIRVLKPASRIQCEAAVFTYDLDEDETVFGQKQHARYHGTDTWLFRDGVWQIVAGQMFRYYEDPAEGVVSQSTLPEYTGIYQMAPGVTRTVKSSGDHLVLEREGRPSEPLLPEAPDLFFRRGVEGRILFHRDSTGQVDALIDRRNNEDLSWRKQSLASGS